MNRRNQRYSISAPKFKDYESAIKRLEQITVELESGEVGLEQSIQLYTEGLQIAKLCDEKLNEATRTIKLVTEQNGLITESDFSKENE